MFWGAAAVRAGTPPPRFDGAEPAGGGCGTIRPLREVIASAFPGPAGRYPGRFNAPGALVAVYFLSGGIMGLNVPGVPSCVQNLLCGGRLILAQSASQIIRKQRPID